MENDDIIRNDAYFKRNPNPEPIEISPEYSESLIKTYELFKDKIFNPQSVFYPCCNIDGSPVKSFHLCQSLIPASLPR